MGDRILRVAVLLPCHNEAVAIAEVVVDFRRHLSGATVYVFDNASTDATAEIAKAAGAAVFRVPLRGKGNVVRRMFSDIDADVYVLADGDATYDAADAPAMIECLLANRLDMVVGARIGGEGDAYRAGHRIGNRVLTGFVGLLFNRTFTDMLSGYRVLSRRFVKSFPAHAAGFEMETELTVHALELRMPVIELPSRYRARPDGSESKLRTWRDGARILMTIIKLTKDERPLMFFSVIALVTALISVALSVPLLETWAKTGLVPRFPTAILSAALMVMAAVFLISGLILDAVSRARVETKRMAYLSCPAPGNET